MRMRSQLYTAVAFMGFYACSASYAHAQGEAQTGDQTGFREIVVTAQKRAENLQDVPVAVTALAAEQLVGANIDGQLTLPKLTPNLNFTVVSSFASAYIRGVGTQFANPGLESSVSVYLDDTYLPRAASGMFTFNDLERIEVLKGPQGTLYGRNATGGAIRLITHDPKPEFQGAASVTYGTDNRFAIDGMLNVPLGEGAALRVAARHDQNDGFMKNIAPNRDILSPRNFMNRNEELYTAKLLLEPTPNLTIKISGDYETKNDNEGHAFQNLFPGAPEQIGAVSGGCVATKFYNICNNNNAFENVYSGGATGRIDYDVGPAVLSSITAYRRIHERNCADLDGTGFNLQWSCGVPSTKQWTQEFQIASDNSGPLRYVVGLYYLWEHSHYAFSVNGEAINGSIGAGFGIPVATFQSGGKGVKTNSYAGFAQVDYDVSDSFTVTAGARYTKEKKRLVSNWGGVGVTTPEGFSEPGSVIRAPLGPCTAPGQVLCEADSDSIKFNKLSPKLTLSWKPNDDLLVYATASRGFKSGGYNLPSFGFVDSVKPETLDTLELGWKFESSNIRFNGAAFYYDYKDLQIQLTDQTTGGTRVKNAAAAKIWGIEADLSWIVSDQFELGAGGGYLDTQYKKFRGDAYVPCGEVSSLPSPDALAAAGIVAGQAACAAQGGFGLALVGGQQLSGNALVNSPKFSGYVRGQFTQPLDGNGKVTLSSVLNYRTRAWFDPANRFEDKKRLLLSGRLQWTSEEERYFIALYGENLTGKKYYMSRPAQATGGWQTPAPPRQVYVQAGLRF